MIDRPPLTGGKMFHLETTRDLGERLRGGLQGDLVVPELQFRLGIPLFRPIFIGLLPAFLLKRVILYEIDKGHSI